MKSSARKVELASVDDLFTTEESRQDATREKIMEIPLTELFPFEDHPFSVRDDNAMKETVESVKEYGVLAPCLCANLISTQRQNHFPFGLCRGSHL